MSTDLPDLEAAAREAELVFAKRSFLQKAGMHLQVDGPLQEIDLPSLESQGKTMGIDTQSSTSEFVALFTQHHPDEFALRLQNVEGEVLLPLLEKTWKGSHEHNDEVSSVGIDLEGEIRLEALEKWLGEFLQQFGPDIYRTKGVLAVLGQDRRVVIQGVHMLLDHTFERPWGNEARRNRIVFIGRNLDRERIVTGFRTCLA
jgi:G3E family GTPase